MKEFPRHLRVQNKGKFPQLYFNRLKCYLRKAIYEHVICKTEEEYFSLDKFKEDQEVKDLDLVKKAVSDVIPELEEQLGWKCKLSYGGTGLFIFSTEKPPKNCWEDEETFV